MFCRHLTVGAYAVNCFLVGDGDSEACAIIDPGDDADSIRKLLEETSRVPELILITHSHFDHLGAVEQLRAEYPSLGLACHATCAAAIQDPRLNLSVPIAGRAVRLAPPEQVWNGGETFAVAGLEGKAIHVSGHDPGHLVYYFPAAEIAFCGDTVFAGGIGRSDLPGGNESELLHNIRSLIDSLPDQTLLWPGHGPATTVAEEKKSNPYLQLAGDGE